MKRLIFLTLPILITLSAAFLFWAYEPELPEAGQRALDVYLRYTNTDATSPWQVRQVAQANIPTAFPAELETTTFGDGTYFALDYHLQPDLAGGSERPLPYPPEDLWCALLTTARDHQRVVFIARHADLYKAVWAVHLVPMSETLEAEVVEQVGCALDLN